MDRQNKDLYAGMCYEACLRKYADCITRICVVHCGNEEDAKDCFQNVFVKLYTSDITFENEEHLKAWLIRVAINECTDCYRQVWKHKMTLSDDISSYMNESSQRTNTESSYNVMEVLVKLPLKYRQVIYLYYYEDFKISEIARELMLSENTVKTRLVRGRKKLEQLMKDEKRFQVFQEFHVVS